MMRGGSWKFRVNVDADSGFDIGGNSAIAYALLK
jgi:hypothetical protein